MVVSPLRHSNRNDRTAMSAAGLHPGVDDLVAVEHRHAAVLLVKLSHRRKAIEPFGKGGGRA